MNNDASVDRKDPDGHQREQLLAAAMAKHQELMKRPPNGKRRLNRWAGKMIRRQSDRKVFNSIKQLARDQKMNLVTVRKYLKLGLPINREIYKFIHHCKGKSATAESEPTDYVETSA